MKRWAEVQAWRDRLRALSPDVGLSPEGARVALDAALDALDDVPRHLGRPAPGHTVIVCASTVFTASIEWAAVLLARGGRVTLKAPRAHAAWFAEVAACTDLPILSTTDRDVLQDADCLVVMGSDATLDAIRSQLGPRQRLLGFGHRYSLTWWSDPDQADAVALDLALHDGRGCMSPLGVFSPLPDAVELLSHAMERLQARLPRGDVAPMEGAGIRSRAALARVLGQAVDAPDWSVHALPAARFPEPGLPRAAVVHPADRATFEAAVHTHLPKLSTVATDAPATLEGVRGVRVCAPGEMQRPPLDRLHDGVDWLREL
ncbi:MAG: acyl-CoA reductase [Myxococcota bacterium]